MLMQINKLYMYIIKCSRQIGEMLIKDLDACLDANKPSLMLDKTTVRLIFISASTRA